jgi:hypothetical protein
MPHYYCDIETTGLDSDKDEIISIQFQKMLLDSGRPEAPLTILTSWEKGSSELKILEKIYPLITSPNPWKFVPVGNNLNFEFKFLLSKIAMHLGIEIEPLFFHSRPYIDLKHVMILLNGGRFKGYHLILKKIGTGINVPVWYRNKEYLKIIEYIQMEAKSFTDFYTDIHQLLFHRHSQLLTVKGGIKSNVI